MLPSEANAPAIGDLCKIVDRRKAFPHDEHGEILYSNLENDIRVGDILLVTSEEETKFGKLFYVIKNGVHSPVHSFFTEKYVGERECSR